MEYTKPHLVHGIFAFYFTDQFRIGKHSASKHYCRNFWILLPESFKIRFSEQISIVTETVFAVLAGICKRFHIRRSIIIHALYTWMYDQFFKRELIVYRKQILKFLCMFQTDPRFH